VRGWDRLGNRAFHEDPEPGHLGSIGHQALQLLGEVVDEDHSLGACGVALAPAQRESEAVAIGVERAGGWLGTGNRQREERVRRQNCEDRSR
jgi:hypothetical protein